jgi:hypothetical protein
MNNKDNFEISQELEQMREQFNILSRKVEDENIVTDSILDVATLKENIYTVDKSLECKRIMWRVVLSIMVAYFMVKQMYPLWSCIVIPVLCLLNAAVYYYKRKTQDNLLDYAGDLKEFVHRVKILKSHHIYTSIFSNIITVTAVALFVWVYMGHNPGLSHSSITNIAIFIIVFIGTLIWYERKKLSTLNEIIKDIEQ